MPIDDDFHAEMQLNLSFPMIDWAMPMPLATPKASGLACRYCIALKGMKGGNPEPLFQTAEEFSLHLFTEHTPKKLIGDDVLEALRARPGGEALVEKAQRIDEIGEEIMATEDKAEQRALAAEALKLTEDVFALVTEHMPR